PSAPIKRSRKLIMSSPGHRTRSAQEEKRYARIRARISQAEQQASEAIHELNFRMSTPYMQNQVQQFLHYQYADWSEKFLVSYRKWNISMVNIFSKRPVPAAVIAFGRILSGPSKEHRAGEARWVDIHAEGQQAS